MTQCSLEAPYAEDFMRGLSPVTLGFFALFLLLSLSTCGLFMELWVYLSRNISCTLIKDRCLIILGLFPVITIAAQLGMTVPRAAALVDLITSVYTGAALFAFFHLTVAYLGGEEEMLDRIQTVDSDLSVGPCCCCFLCLPRIRINRRIYTVFRIGISQTIFLLPIMNFIIAVLWTDGKYFKEKGDTRSPVFYLGIVMMISTLLSLFVFNIMIKTGLKIAEQRYRLLPKYSIVMIAVVINSLQPLLIEVLTAYNVIPSTEEFHWHGRASEFNHMLKVVEAFILMLLSRRFYRKPYPPSETEALSFVNTVRCTP
ncbi:organic solute transporter subunit alpha-like [Lampris incognitus]|uniref:organic solute transporter subunit alpha-like n=1 Tax=Lampris incognitus TaxID=2546036 RepID=UPI0024B59F10|nr:organic solute transporter subunit alpha-like [Lampris incognitus]